MMERIKKVLSLNKNKEERKSVNDHEFFAMVQKKAHELYEKRGCKEGNDFEDWLTAERLVKEELSR